VPVDDVTTLSSSRQFADIKVTDDQLRDLVTDSDKHYVYAVSSTQVMLLLLLLLLLMMPYSSLPTLAAQ